MIKKLEKAIRHFECMRDDNIVVLNSGFGTKKGEHNSLYKNRKMYAELAIEALEKQIAKEVIDRVAMIDVYGEYDGDMCKCPKCEVQLYDEGGIFYCHWCGQKLQGFRLE